ncbi:MAG TPA: RDD family protein [Bryobacteraceae bacterium]|jgi:uncharacterized RDD family membrane protein YckC
MTWFYADGGRQMGPVEESALDDLVRQGVVRDDTLVWREGMATWQAHGIVRPRPVAPPPPPAPAPPPPPPQPAYVPPQPQYTAPEPQYTPPQPQYTPPEPQYTPPQPQYSAPAQPQQPVQPSPQASPQPNPGVEMRYCAECGRGYPAYELSMVGAAAVCGSCRPVVMQRMGPAAYMPPPAAMAMGGGRRYAGFWIRFLALFIDGVILGVVSMIIRIPLVMIGIGGAAATANLDNPGDVAAILPMIMGLIGISVIIQLVLTILYQVYFLTSRGATPGKMALGLKVIRADGGPISAGLAIGRFFAFMLSGLTLYIGFIIAGFDAEKRSLHDRICDTRVVYAK